MKIIYRFACASYDVGKLDNFMYATKKCIKNALYPDLKKKQLYKTDHKNLV